MESNIQLVAEIADLNLLNKFNIQTFNALLSSSLNYQIYTPKCFEHPIY